MHATALAHGYSFPELNMLCGSDAEPVRPTLDVNAFVRYHAARQQFLVAHATTWLPLTDDEFASLHGVAKLPATTLAEVGGLAPLSGVLHATIAHHDVLPDAALLWYMNLCGVAVDDSFPHMHTLWAAVQASATVPAPTPHAPSSCIAAVSLASLLRMPPAVHKGSNLITKLLLQRAAIPNFRSFVEDVALIFQTVGTRMCCTLRADARPRP
ncbi:hypothetical protein EON66_04945 [archaeon]|nr:MAG: hypothetical protein EON66_04945 [archaeon]